MHDMKAIRDDANAIIEFNRNPLVDPDNAAHRLAAFVRDITDETPLTVEALEREGFVVGDLYFDYDRAQLTVRFALKETVFFVHDYAMPSQSAPRTVGDLRRLQYQLQRDGGK